MWNTSGRRSGYAYILRYVFEHQAATLTWMQVRRKIFELEPEAVRSWREVRAGDGCRPLEVQVAPLGESMENIVGAWVRCVYQHLALQELFIDPITLQQLEAEVAVWNTAWEMSSASSERE